MLNPIYTYLCMQLFTHGVNESAVQSPPPKNTKSSQPIEANPALLSNYRG